MDLVQIVQAEWPIEDFVFMRDGTGFAKWLGREVHLLCSHECSPFLKIPIACANITIQHALSGE